MIIAAIVSLLHLVYSVGFDHSAPPYVTAGLVILALAFAVGLGWLGYRLRAEEDDEP